LCYSPLSHIKTLFTTQQVENSCGVQAENKLNELAIKLKEEKQVAYTFKNFTSNENQIIFYLTNLILAELDISFLQEVLHTLLIELINNAYKANLKRLYFEEKNIDIQDKDKYDELIKTFKEDVVERVSTYTGKVDASKYFIQFNIINKGDHVILSLFNNSPMSAKEYKRVNERLELAKRISSIAEAFDEMADDTEGAGLGLILNLMLLKTSGIGINNFLLKTNEKGTAILLRIPTRLNIPDNVKEIEKKITQNLDAIPTFPITINNILALCDDSESNMSQVVSEIEKDPSLAANILKLANSSGYMTNQKATSILTASTIIGINGIREMTLGVSAKKILDNHVKQFKGFWEHSYRCAFYAKKLTEHAKMKKNIDTIYLGGLLHDIGKLVLYSVDSTILNEINGLSKNTKKTSSSILEEITIGASHVKIGASLAKRWNFNSLLINMIRFHHSPSASEEKYRDAVSVIHVADALIRVEKKKSQYVYIDIEARKLLNLTNDSDIALLHFDLQQEYQELEEN